MAEQYFAAANLLLDDIQSEQVEDYKVGVPVLFLYRHWLELAVKSIISPVRGHDLEKLSDALTSHLAKHGVRIPEWVTFRLEEMAQ